MDSTVGLEIANMTYQTGRDLHGLGRYPEAAAAFTRALQLRPDYQPAVVGLGRTLAVQLRWSAAVTCFRNALVLDPADLATLADLITALTNLGDQRKKRAVLEELLPGSPHRAPILFQLAWMLQEDRRWQDAANLLLEVVALAPDFVDAHGHLGYVFERLQRWTDAAEAYTRAADTAQPDRSLAFQARADTCRLEGEAGLLQRQLDDGAGDPAQLIDLALLQGALNRWHRASVTLRRAVEAGPQVASAWLHLGHACTHIGRWEEAAAAYERAVGLDPDLAGEADSRYRTKLNYETLQAGPRPDRTAVDNDRLTQQILNNINGLPVQYPRVSLCGHRHTILLAALPKSGSSFLNAGLSGLFGFAHVPLSFHFERSEQDLYLPNLLHFASIDTVSQHHLRATDANMRLISAFSVKTIVLVRNLHDALVSLRDHLVNEGPAFMGCHVDESFATMAKPEQYDMLIDLAAPWLIHFYVSWFRAVQARRVRVHWLSYEGLTTDGIGSVRDICAFVGISKPDADIERALAIASGQKHRFNVGRTGRGQTELGEAGMRRVTRLCSHYPDVDFSAVGIVRS